jgi:decaheme cytochrome c component MtrC/MtrF-like protein
MKIALLLLPVWLSIGLSSLAQPPEKSETPAATAEVSAAQAKSGCRVCHDGIESIRQPDSEMMQQILELGQGQGDPAGCVVCHGGDPEATEKEAAHGGEAFYPDPSSPWINEHTCGQCHEDQVRVQWHSLMMTEAGKIQGVAWSFGALSGYEHRWGNYDVENPIDPCARLGTDAYRRIMGRLKELEPQVFVDRHEALPEAVTDMDKLRANPELSAFTYLRNQCLRCHHAVKGRQKRGDYRGMGCSTCHIPYGNEGFYEGGDATVPRDEPGHMLVHTIQGTRDAKVEVHGQQYTGIPVETCTTCHDRGKRIGVSYQGLMETPYETPYADDGGPQPALHTKHYLAMEQDIHYQKGMLCQDCHTSIDVHSDGFLAAANLGAVEIECSDCHGTPKQYPWDLPLGFGDEFEERPAVGSARGTRQELNPHVLQGMVYDPRDGYLLTARGNPYTNVVRSGNRVIVHTAGGKDIEMKPLRLIAELEELSTRGRVAMQTVDLHMNRLECYTCHTSWAPQCYGCHVKIDFSGGVMNTDWLAGGAEHMRPECAADRGEAHFDKKLPGKVSESRSFLRWEDPPLGVNGEGRVTPLMPGCQVSTTVVGPDRKPILTNHIFRGLPNKEGAGPEGQLSLDMSPVHPHTMTKNARTCESCHASEKALGHGIGGGKMRPPDQAVVVDLETAEQKILPKNVQTQMSAIDGLGADWSRLVTEEGQQLQTVGHHFSGSRPLNNEERSHIDRSGVCLSCHQEIPDQSLAVSLLHHVAEFTGQMPKTDDQHNSLLHKIMLTAGWVQVTGMVGLPLMVVIGGGWWLRRRRRRAANG